MCSVSQSVLLPHRRPRTARRRLAEQIDKEERKELARRAEQRAAADKCMEKAEAILREARFPPLTSP